MLTFLLGISACAQSNVMEVKGKIYVKGTEPHTYVAIEDINTHKVYKIVNPKEFDLLQKQKEILKLKAIHIKKAIGPGFPTEIKVIDIE